MSTDTPSQDCPRCGRFVQDRPNEGLTCECGWRRRRMSNDRWQQVIDNAPPAPSPSDPDGFHRRIRERLFQFHEGPRQTLFRGAYGLEPGDRIVARRIVWTVLETHRWDDGRGHHVVLRRESDGMVGDVEIPWNHSGGQRGVQFEVLTSPHHPVCADCGQPWPCQHVDDAFAAHEQARQAARHFERQAQYPHLCEVCGQRRFATERGRKQHESWCRKRLMEAS